MAGGNIGHLIKNFSMRKSISKKMRELVYAKCNGHCGYCGCELAIEDMQVDHMDSVYQTEYMHKEVDNSINNYMPACRACNYYKRESSVEQFRANLTDILMRNVRRPFDYRLALKYGLITENIKPIKFYFETL